MVDWKYDHNSSLFLISIPFIMWLCSYSHQRESLSSHLACALWLLLVTEHIKVMCCLCQFCATKKLCVLLPFLLKSYPNRDWLRGGWEKIHFSWHYLRPNSWPGNWPHMHKDDNYFWTRSIEPSWWYTTLWDKRLFFEAINLWILFSRQQLSDSF